MSLEKREVRKAGRRRATLFLKTNRNREHFTDINKKGSPWKTKFLDNKKILLVGILSLQKYSQTPFKLNRLPDLKRENK